MSTALNGAVRFVDLQAQIQSLQPALNQAMQAVLDRGDFILGKDVELFEQEFAAYCGVPHAVGVDSGLSALELALRVLRIGPGDEVITQANTFIASAGAILAVGARPVLVDCDDDGVIRPDAVRAALTPATGAIMPVHLFGRICDIEAIMAIADAAGVPVVEDACQAHGALLNGRRAGSFGIASAFSFYPAKNLGAFGDAGMLLTRSAELAGAVRTFCYPFGGIGERTPRLVAGAGFLGACTTRSGLATARTDPYLLPRVKIAYRDDLWGLLYRLRIRPYLP